MPGVPPVVRLFPDGSGQARALPERSFRDGPAPAPGAGRQKDRNLKNYTTAAAACQSILPCAAAVLYASRGSVTASVTPSLKVGCGRITEASSSRVLPRARAWVISLIRSDARAHMRWAPRRRWLSRS